MLIQDIANTMSDLEREALEAFQTCAKGFDAFNKGAANVVRELLKINEELREENNQLRIEIYRLRDVDVDSIKIGGTDSD